MHSSTVVELKLEGPAAVDLAQPPQPPHPAAPDAHAQQPQCRARVVVLVAPPHGGDDDVRLLGWWQEGPHCSPTAAAASAQAYGRACEVS